MRLHARFACLAAAVLLTASSGASAQIFRAYLALDGNDANPCTLVAPCRLLPAALAAVSDGGEVWMLDSANYNTSAVNIAKSVTILAVPGAVGSVVALGGNALQIVTPGVRVKLRNLVIIPFPGNGQFKGIEMLAGDRLVLESCNISGFRNGTTGWGVWIEAAAHVTIADSNVSENYLGVLFYGGAIAGVTAQVTGSRFNHNDAGIFATSKAGTTRVAVTRSTASDNTVSGFAAEGIFNNTTVELAVMDSQASNNDSGITATSNIPTAVAVVTATGNQVTGNTLAGLQVTGTGARLIARGNTVTRNGTGLSNASALLESAQDNAVRGNTAETSGTITNFSGL